MNPSLQNHIPKHIAFIMDGNRRWATKHGKSSEKGHKAGLEALERILKLVEKQGVEFVTLYIFSTENWLRSKSEVSFLMKLLSDTVNSWQNRLNEFNYKLKFIGRTDKLPVIASHGLSKLCSATKSNTGMTVTLAIDYGGHDEIFRAAKKLVSYCMKKKTDLDKKDSKFFESFLDTQGLPDPDLLIRSGGEKRLSNFLLWQLAYTEIMFINEFWPDINDSHIIKALEKYRNVKRNFGG